MKPESREKVALIVFCLLIVFGVGILGFYIFAGHSWNVAASNIDDSFGSMDGYVSILFEGTRDKELVSADKTSDEGTVGDETQGSVDSVAKEDTASQELKERASSAIAVDASSASKSSADINEIKRDYASKQASVLTIYLSDRTRYQETKFFMANGESFAVFNVSAEANINSIKAQLLTLNNYSLDCVIAIVEDRTYLKNIEGIDIAICMADDELSSTGEYLGNTFCVSSPYLGNVGALLISPSNVVSFKIFSTTL